MTRSKRLPARRCLRRRFAATGALLLMGTLYMSLSASSTAAYPDSPQYQDRAFRNPVVPKTFGWREAPRMWWRFLFGKSPTTQPPLPIPLQAISAAQLETAPDNTLYRVGHSTLLIKLAGGWWLTDPVFSERASPVQWAGPKRFHAPAIALEALPPLAGVILSHDHYDHLDKAAILALAPKTARILAPLGVGDLLVRWGVDADKITQLDWWQSAQVGAVSLTATPAQHFSGRAPFQRNATLWASWAIQAPGFKLFFSGDSGYFPGFREIGQRLGPFDLTLIECGAYDPNWEGVHMLPQQSVQAHLDLRGRWMLPIHNSTFDLAFHDWNAPLESVAAIAEQRGVALTTPLIGQAVNGMQMEPFERWWRQPRLVAAP